MTTVTARAHGGLERHIPGAGPWTLDLPPGATLLHVQDLLGIPRGDVGLFLVDGEMRHEDAQPASGAVIDLYPMFGGG